MDPEKKQAASHAFVQLDAGFPKQLVVCKIYSKTVPVPERMPSLLLIHSVSTTVDEYSMQ